MRQVVLDTETTGLDPQQGPDTDPTLNGRTQMISSGTSHGNH